MNDYLEKYYWKKKPKKKQKVKKIQTNSQMINNNKNNQIYFTNPTYFFYSNNYYTNIYNSYDYNSPVFNFNDYNYYINDEKAVKNKIYLKSSKPIKANNSNYETIKINNMDINQKQLHYKTNSFNNKSNKNENSFNYNNYYNVHTYNKSNKFNNNANPYFYKNINSINENQNFIFDSNQNSFIQNRKSFSVIPHNLNLTEDLNKNINIIYETNEKRNNILFISQPVEQNFNDIKPIKKKIMRINIQTYEPEHKNNKNLNNIIQTRNLKIKHNEYLKNNYKQPQIDNLDKIIISKNESYEINHESDLFQMNDIKTKNNIEILSQVRLLNRSQKLTNPILNKALVNNENPNKTVKKLIIGKKTIKQNVKGKNKNNNIKRNNIPANNTKINKLLQKKSKIIRKKLNVNFLKKNLTSMNDSLNQSNNEPKTNMKSPHSSKKKNQQNNTRNSDVKKFHKNFLKVPSNNNTLFFSINTSKVIKPIDIKESDKYNDQYSILSNKIKSIETNLIINQMKTKKECDLCHILVNSKLINVHKMSHPSQIFKYLFLGNFVHATNITELKKLKINYILNCAIECHNYNLPKNVKELHLKIKDLENFDIINYFEISNEFINKCKLMGGTCLVHCKLGVSRSTTLVIAYLMKFERLGVDDAFNFVKKKRISIKPNAGFMKQLYEYEKILRENE